MLGPQAAGAAAAAGAAQLGAQAGPQAAGAAQDGVQVGVHPVPQPVLQQGVQQGLQHLTLQHLTFTGLQHCTGAGQQQPHRLAASTVPFIEQRTRAAAVSVNHFIADLLNKSFPFGSQAHTAARAAVVDSRTACESFEDSNCR